MPLTQAGGDLDPGVLAVLALLDRGEVQHVRRVVGDPEVQSELLELGVRQGTADPGDLGDRGGRPVVTGVRGGLTFAGDEFDVPPERRLRAYVLDPFGNANAHRGGRGALAP